jgi:hypothetical protein
MASPLTALARTKATGKSRRALPRSAGWQPALGVRSFNAVRVFRGLRICRLLCSLRGLKPRLFFGFFALRQNPIRVYRFSFAAAPALLRNPRNRCVFH